MNATGVIISAMRLCGAVIGLAALEPSSALERLEPPEGCYFGFTIGSGRSVSELNGRLGFTPAVYVEFFDFSTTLPNRAEIRSFLAEVAAVPAIAMLTLEPWRGLDSIAEADCLAIAELCAEAEGREIAGIFIRFGHEMNGNWYPWGQKPALFKAKFRLLAQAVRSRTMRTALLWAPNYGVGYPFGEPRPAPGSPDFVALDTNRDGRLTDRDDMYEPYYPGNDAVDWVGMTLYHWGVDFPWRENEMPVSGSLAGSLTGSYQGSIRDFYQQFCLDPERSKPMAITETAAFYNTEMPGPAELEIKQAWWNQVFGDIPRFPKVKCVNWFDECKREEAAQNDLIDWRVSADPAVRAAFLQAMRRSGAEIPYFLSARDTLDQMLEVPVLSISRGEHHLVVSWGSKASRRYQLAASHDLRRWTPVSDVMEGTGTRLRVLFDRPDGRNALEFFRVEVVGP